METMLRQRMSLQDAHYGGMLVDGARIIGLFGDAATELLIMNDGDEGLFRSYESIDFLAPVFAGDYLEVHAEINHFGNTSRKMKFTCYKSATSRPDISPSSADILQEKILVCQAVGTCIVKKELQRK